MKEGLVIINKYNESVYFWQTLCKRLNIDSDIKEVIKNYKGFEGLFSSLHESSDCDGTEWGSITSYAKYEEYYHSKNKDNLLLLLYLNRTDGDIPSVLSTSFEFAGYDYGYCKNENSLFSSVFNEVLFGTKNLLIEYAKYLNNYYLFSEKTIALEYAKTHSTLQEKALDVEDDNGMELYKIWFYHTA